MISFHHSQIRLISGHRAAPEHTHQNHQLRNFNCHRDLAASFWPFPDFIPPTAGGRETQREMTSDLCARPLWSEEIMDMVGFAPAAGYRSERIQGPETLNIPSTTLWAQSQNFIAKLHCCGGEFTHLKNSVCSITWLFSRPKGLETSSCLFHPHDQTSNFRKYLVWKL